MSEEIRVRLVEFSDRRHYQLQWTCPNTGRKKTKSSGVERVTGTKRERDEASKAAAKLEEKLKSGDHAIGDRLTCAWTVWRLPCCARPNPRHELPRLPRHKRPLSKRQESIESAVSQ